MDIKLVSQDNELYKLCREVIAEIPEIAHSWTISLITAKDVSSEADLYIWDYQPNLAIPGHVNWRPSKHLFLVDRKDLASFRQHNGAVEANVLLKPVTHATLSAVLGLAVSDWATTSLRADRDEILQCLIQTNLKLQEYDHDRTNFLARAVHDFRAPLTALSGYCGLLLSEPLGPLTENQKEVLRRMQHSAKRLSRMASAMFHLSIGRQVRKRPDLRKADIRKCVDQALHEITPFADEKCLTITADLEDCEHDLYFEAGQIEQVLINILDNACKFTPKAGSIEIRGYPYFWERRTSGSQMPLTADRRRRAVHEPNSYRIDLRDSGAAIPEEHLERIFEEYTSYAGGRDRSGGGLGLAICKMIILQHDGCVWAENTRSGPLFSFVLPVHRVQPHLDGDNDGQSHVQTVGGFEIHADIT